MSVPLLNWRGDPVIPRAWLDGYLTVHLVQKEPAPTMGAKITRWQYIGPVQARKLERALANRREDGMNVGIFMNCGRCLIIFP